MGLKVTRRSILGLGDLIVLENLKGNVGLED